MDNIEYINGNVTLAATDRDMSGLIDVMAAELDVGESVRVKVKSVIKFWTVKLILFDPNGKELKKYDYITNNIIQVTAKTIGIYKLKAETSNFRGFVRLVKE